MRTRINRETQWQAIEFYRHGLSERGVARELGVSPATVHYILVRHDEPRRTMSEAKMKYPKEDFSDDPAELARIIGFLEDCGARPNRKQIHVATSTTHTAQISLFEDIFARYGHVNKTPGYNKQSSLYYWHVYVDLKRPSFDFVLEYKKNPMKLIAEIDENGCEYNHIGSLTDAEGWIGIADLNDCPKVILEIANNSRQLIDWTRRKLGGGISRTNDCYKLRLYDDQAVEALTKLPISHAEKISARELILRHWYDGGIGLPALWEYQALRRRIDMEVRLCSVQARLEWIKRHGKPHRHDPDKTMPPN